MKSTTDQWYATIDLPERGQTMVFITTKRMDKDLYRVMWSRELECQDPLTIKDEMAMQVAVIDLARKRVRARDRKAVDVYLV